MNGNKINKLLLVTSILSIIILSIGITFSYFSYKKITSSDAISLEAGKINLSLTISPIYTGHKLFPLNDSDILIAYNNKCMGDNGFGACLAYNIEISNYSTMQELIGTIDFTVNNIKNLSYIVLDENNNIYLDKVSIKDGNDKLPLGSKFTLDNASNLLPTKRNFILVIWLTNLDESQDEYDAYGTFNANITYSSIYGNNITGTIYGSGKEALEDE